MEELLNKKFGMLTVVASSDVRTKDKLVQVKCRCDCGTTVLVPRSKLRSGSRKSCGCTREAIMAKGRIKGQRKSVFQQYHKSPSRYMVDPEFD